VITPGGETTPLVGKSDQDPLETAHVTGGQPGLLPIDVVAQCCVSLRVIVDGPVMSELSGYLTPLAVDGFDAVVEAEDAVMKTVHGWLKGIAWIAYSIEVP
jgi:hypothetical protein